MRDFITGLAIVVIFVLTAALAAPYFIDWSSQRGFLEARLSHALGQKVTIGGTIDLKLLPTPYLVLGQTVIGKDDAPITIGIRHLDLELSIAPLLHGEFDIVEAQLEEPTIRVTLERDRTLPALPGAPAFSADVRFDRISVTDGTLAIADPESGRTFVYDHLDLQAEAPSLAGPFKVSGTEGDTSSRTKFRLSTTTAENGKARARLVIEETAAHGGIDIDGSVALRGATRETLRQSFDGTVVLSGHFSRAKDEPVAWKLSGPLKADPQQASLDAGELRIGGDDAGLTLQATGHGDFGEHTRLKVGLVAKQLDLDRLSGAPADATRPAPPQMPALATLRQTLGAALPPLPATVDIAVDAATYGGETLSDLKARLETAEPDRAGKVPLTLQLSGDGPGGLHVAVDGSPALSGQGGFAGKIDLSAEDLPHTIAWLATIDPRVALKPDDIPFHAVKLAGAFKSDGNSLDASQLSLTLDRSTLTGAVHAVPGAANRATKITADLDADALDLDALPAISTFDGSASPFDLDLRLAAKAVRVSRVGDSTIETGKIALAVGRSGPRTELRQFKADNLGGATIDATGSLDPKSATLAMRFEAAHLEAAAALYGRLAPGPIAEALKVRAPALAPGRLEIDAAFARREGGGLDPTKVAVRGQLGATKIDASLKPNGGSSSLMTLAATLDAPRSGALLRQLGFETLPIDTAGAGHVRLSANGQADKPLETKADATFGATSLAMAGQFALLSGTRSGSGTIGLESPDLGPLLQTLAVAFPDMTGRIPADLHGRIALDERGVVFDALSGTIDEIGVAGGLTSTKPSGDKPTLTGALTIDRLALSRLTGFALGPSEPPAANVAWSDLPFGAGLVDPPRAAIALTIGRLDLTPYLQAEKATLDLVVAPNLVTLNNLSAKLRGGTLEGRATLRRDGSQATAEGRIAVSDVGVDLPSLKTHLSGDIGFAGGGRSMLSLVSSLAGTGHASWRGTVVPGADPNALPKVFADIENDALAVDEDSIIRALESSATKAPLDLGDKTFGVGLATGVLHLRHDAQSDANQPVGSTLDATLDLRGPRFEENITQILHALPANWSGAPPAITVTLSGSPDRPERATDVSGLVNGVAARALARESARIEAYEFDIRERAFFNRRLLSERRREQDRVKAEEDAKTAEADRKARLEAARLERQRKDAAAKAAREKQDQVDRDKAQRPDATPDRTPPGPQETQRFQAPQPGAATDPSAAGRY